MKTGINDMRFYKVGLPLLLGILAFFFFTCSSAPDADTRDQREKYANDSVYDVFLVAGQSNTYYGLGYDSILDKPSPGIYQLGRDSANNMKVILAKEPLQHWFTKPNRIGFALTFAKLYKRYSATKNNILLIPCGMDNTGFNGNGWNKGDFLYADALNRTNYILTRFPKSKLVAILWHQGELDVHYKNYQKALDTMIVNFRKDITGASNKTPFIVGGMVPYWVEMDPARENQQKIIKDTKNRLPNIGYVDPYLPFRISKLKDSLDTEHYDAIGQRKMGRRYFEEYKKLANKISE